MTSNDATLEQDDGSVQHGRALSETANKPPSLPGYELRHHLGEGTFGSVWGGTQISTGQSVAVKLLTRVDGLNLRFFASELDRLTQVAEHPHIVTVLDAKLEWDPPFIVTSWVKGGALSDRSQASRPEICAWLAQSAEALQFTHDKGIIHCDLKPSNILLDEQSRVRVVDFGQSRSAGMTEGALGTLGFMAPEQCAWGTEERGSTPNVRWDIYGLGATIYWLLSGRCPRLEPEDHTALAAVASTSERLRHYQDVLRTRSLQPLANVDSDLKQIVTAMLELDPRRRTGSMAEVLEDLRRRQSGDPLLCRRPWRPSYRLGRWMRKPVVAVTLLALLLGGAAAGHSYVRVVEEKERADKALVQAQLQRALAADEAGDGVLASLWTARAAAAAPDAALRLQFQPFPLLWEGRAEPGPVTWNKGQLQVGSAHLDPGTGRALSSAALPPAISEQQATRLDEHYNGLLTAVGRTVALRCAEDGNRWWVRVYDRGTGRAISPRIDQNGYFGPMALSPDGRLVATRPYPHPLSSGVSLSGKVVEVYQVDNGQRQVEPLDHPDEVRALAFGPQQLACGCADGSLRVWSLRHGSLKAGGMRLSASVVSLAYSPDGKMLVGVSQDGRVRAWDASAGWPRLVPVAQGINTQAAWTAEGHLLTITADGWQESRPPEFTNPKRHASALTYQAQLSPRGRFVADVVEGELRLWSTARASLQRSFKLEGEFHFLTFSPDESVITVLSSSQLLLIATGSSEAPRRFPLPFEAASASIALDSKRSQLLVADSQLRLLDLLSGKFTRSWPGQRSACAISPEAGVLASGDTTGQVQVGDPRPVLIEDFKEEADRRVSELHFIDSQTVVSGSMDGQIGVWNRSGRVFPAWRFPTPGPVSFGVAGSRVAAASGGLLRIWSLQDGRPLSPWYETEENALALAMSPNGEWLCVTGASGAQVLDLRSPAGVADWQQNVEKWSGCQLDPHRATLQVVHKTASLP